MHYCVDIVPVFTRLGVLQQTVRLAMALSVVYHVRAMALTAACCMHRGALSVFNAFVQPLPCHAENLQRTVLGCNLCYAVLMHLGPPTLNFTSHRDLAAAGNPVSILIWYHWMQVVFLVLLDPRGLLLDQAAAPHTPPRTATSQRRLPMQVGSGTAAWCQALLPPLARTLL